MIFSNGKIIPHKKASKESHLDNVVAAEFRKGSTHLHYKTYHVDEDFKAADILKEKFLSSWQMVETFFHDQHPTKESLLTVKGVSLTIF